MSEEAKLVYIQEKLKDAKRNERFGFISIVFGAIFIGGYIILSQLDPTFPLGVPLLVIAIFLVAAGFILGVYYSYEYRKLMNQLEKMADIKSICPKCRKEMPKGNFDFCPFCGASLKPTT